MPQPHGDVLTPLYQSRGHLKPWEGPHGGVALVLLMSSSPFASQVECEGLYVQDPALG